MAVMKVSFASEALFRSVDINVIVPMETMGIPGESKPKKPEKFKTLYLLHGYSGNQDDWLTYSNIRRLSDEYDLAVVMPCGENSFYLDGHSRGTMWGEMVGRELVEFTRRMFPLSQRREDTFIGGLSMGGFGALRLGSWYHETFGKIFSLSGAFVTDDIFGQTEDYKDVVGDYKFYYRTFGDLNRVKDNEKDPFWCVKQSVASGDIPEVYLACGENDFLIQENRDAKEKLEKLGVKLHYQESPGIHDWKFWNAQIGLAIQWLLG